MTLATILAQADVVENVKASEGGATTTGSLIILLVALAVLIVQLVNNVINNRQSNQVKDKVQELKETITNDINASVGGLNSTVGKINVSVDKLTTTIQGLTSMCSDWQQTSQLVRTMMTIIDRRDDEGRLRIYTPAKSDVTQKQTLEVLKVITDSQGNMMQVIQQINQTQATITTNLQTQTQALQDLISIVTGAHSTAVLTDTSQFPVPPISGVARKGPSAVK